jgi:hypothetical protein
MPRSNLRIEGPRAWSYSTCIKDVLPNGMTIGNNTSYSVTTARHQGRVAVTAADVVVGNVPHGTYHLAEWFMDLVRRLGFVAAHSLFGIGDEDEAGG